MDIRIIRLYNTILTDIIETNGTDAPIGTRTAKCMLECEDNIEAHIKDDTVKLWSCATLYSIVAKYDEIDNRWKQDHVLFKDEYTEEE